MRARTLIAAFATFGALGCSSPRTTSSAVESGSNAPPGQSVVPGKPSAAVSTGATRAIALVTEPAALAAITEAGARFDRLLTAADRAVITAVVRADIALAGKGDSNAGVGIAGNSHRLFDAGWLDRGSFELIGVAARFDRIPMTPATCGDLRLIYRLGYRARTSNVEVASRLPMTVAIVLDGPVRAPVADDPLGCRAAAKAWTVPTALAGRELGIALADGPLAGAMQRDRVRQVLTNTQVVRWPSAVRPDLGGHAEYALRALRAESSELVAAPADFTPDVARLRRDRRARDQLLTWLRDPATLDSVERGSAVLPSELTAPRALSVSPRAWARRANRAYRQVLAPADVAELARPGSATIGSGEALLRRLDEQTCAGCHQAQTIAGFHMLGEDGADVAPGNALATSLSAPLAAERLRRETLIDALANGAKVDFQRPTFERIGNPGGRGARCGLGDPGLTAWTCAAGLSCQHTDAPSDDDAAGECLPPIERREVGDACETGALVAHVDPRRDRGPRAAPGMCVAGACNGNRVGFPGGMCRTACADLPAGGACGVIAELTPFNNCLAKRRPFPECLAMHVVPAGLRGCDADRPCRDDYVCARTPAGDGACTPPYFLFQLRVDGHPPSAAAVR